MNKINYPPKPWNNGQRAMLQPGMEFMYSSSTKRWVPITPGYENEEQLQTSFNVSTVVELAEVFKNQTSKVAGYVTTINSFDGRMQSVEQTAAQLYEAVELSGRIWKTEEVPINPGPNDLWHDGTTGKTFSYYAESDTWVQH